MSLKKFLTTILVILLLFIFSVTFILTRSLSPYNQAKAETIDLASRRADLTQADDFYWFNGEETFFTITGSNSEGTPIVVIVQQDGGAVQVYNEEETVSKEQVVRQTIEREQPEKILEARIGLSQNNPIWEVSFEQENGSVGYTTFSLTTGEWIRTIKNI